VNQVKFPEELEDIATSMRMASGTECSRVELCGALLKSLDREYRNLLENPNARSSIIQRFQEHSSWASGKHIYVEEHSGFEGISEGLDERGFLNVRTDAGLRTILSGTVRAK
jgi:BirA family transcriptional regulator, biotin operon repressor / biotin---[acetyl-CoA-carboxylase] ligase